MQIAISFQLASCMQKSEGCFYFGVAGRCGLLTAMQVVIGSLAVLDVITTAVYVFVNSSIQDHTRSRSAQNFLDPHVWLFRMQNQYHV